MRGLLLCVVVGALAQTSTGQTIEYRAELGTLPDAQGFTFHEGGGGAPPPSVTGGLLHQGPTSSAGYQWWDRTDIDTDFGRGASVSARIRILYSSFASGTLQRTGYYLTLGDRSGRFFYVGIASNLVLLANNHDQTEGLNTITVPVDTTSGERNYHLQVSEGMGRLSIDGNEIAAIPLGGPGLVPPNRTGFGDIAGIGVSETLLRSFSLTAVPSCAADFDGDGFITGLDYDLYVQAFEGGDMSADFDADGFITGLDFDLFVQAFEAGC